MSYRYPSAPRYRFPVPPVNAPGNERAGLSVQILESNEALWNGGIIILKQLNAASELATQTFQFYVSPTPAPSPPTIGVNLTGATGLSDIAAAFVLALAANDWVTDYAVGETAFNLFQPRGGARGNLPVTVAAQLNHFLSLNGLSDFSESVAEFSGGTSAQVPARFGRNYAMLPGGESFVVVPPAPVPVALDFPRSSDILLTGRAYTISGTCALGAAVTLLVDAAPTPVTIVGTSWHSTATWTPVAEGAHLIQVSQIADAVPSADSGAPPALSDVILMADAQDPASFTLSAGNVVAINNLVSGVPANMLTGTIPFAIDPVTQLPYLDFGNGTANMMGAEAAVLAAFNGTNKPFFAAIVYERTAVVATTMEYWAMALSTNTGSSLEFGETASPNDYFVERLGNPSGPARVFLGAGVQEGLTILSAHSADALTVKQQVDDELPEVSGTLTGLTAIAADRFAYGILPRNVPILPGYFRLYQIILCAADKSLPLITLIKNALALRWPLPTGIVLLGDSITRATPFAPAGGWRKSFYDWVLANGRRVDFQGHVAAGTFPDNRCEGYAGNTILDSNARIALDFGAGKPFRNARICCWMIGTNSLADVPQALVDYGTGLDDLYARGSSTVAAFRVAVTTIIPGAVSPELIDEFNAGLPAIWDAFDAAHPGAELIRWNANLALGGVWNNVYWDPGEPTHPNEVGSQLMFTHPVYGLQVAIAPFL